MKVVRSPSTAKPAKKTVVTMRLTHAVVERAKNLVAENAHPVGLDWREPKTGFTVRFIKEGGRYLYRGKHATITLPMIDQVRLDVARHLASEAKQALKSGRDANEYTRTYLERTAAGDDHGAAHVAATNASARTAGVAYDADRPWRWSTLVERFVAHKVEHDLKPGRWANQYGRVFDDEVFASIRNKRAPDISHHDLFSLKRALVPSGTKAGSRAFRIISQTIAALDWALSEEPINCGLLGADPYWRAVAVKYTAGKRTRAPQPAELARMLLATERHAELGDVLASPALQALLLFVFATGQRDGAAPKLRRSMILPHPDHKDWRVAHYSEDEVKGHHDMTLAHAVPLPPFVVRRLEALWETVDPDGESAFAFPSHRKGKHLTASGLNGLFRQLRGRAGKDRPEPKPDRKGKPGPKPRPTTRTDVDLFERYLRDLRPHPEMEVYFVLHDARRSLTNHLGNAGLGRAVSAILAHKMEPIEAHERDEETLRQRMSRTTSKHYFTAQQIDLKTQGMKLWSEALERALEEERARFDTVFPK